MSHLLLKGAGGPVAAAGSIDWTPENESGLLGWWDFSTTTSYSGGVWTKKWGTLANLTNVSSGPTKITNGFSGDKHALTFTDTANRAMAIANPGQESLVIAMAMNVATTAPTALVMNRDVLGVDKQGIMIVDDFGIQAKYKGGTNYAEDLGLTLPAQILMVARLSTSSRILRINGEQTDADTVTNTGTGPVASDSIVFFRDVADGGYSIQVACIGIFTSASWSDALAEKCEGFIAHNSLGHTTSILPLGHTYKSDAPEL